MKTWMIVAAVAGGAYLLSRRAAAAASAVGNLEIGVDPLAGNYFSTPIERPSIAVGEPNPNYGRGTGTNPIIAAAAGNGAALTTGTRRNPTTITAGAAATRRGSPPAGGIAALARRRREELAANMRTNATSRNTTPGDIGAVSTGYGSSADMRTANTTGATGSGNSPVAQRTPATTPRPVAAASGSYVAPTGPTYMGTPSSELGAGATLISTAPASTGIIGSERMSIADYRASRAATVPISTTPATSTRTTTRVPSGGGVPTYKRWD